MCSNVFVQAFEDYEEEVEEAIPVPAAPAAPAPAAPAPAPAAASTETPAGDASGQWKFCSSELCDDDVFREQPAPVC